MTNTSSLTKIDFYKSPAEAWDAMYNDCETAKISIEFEQYIIRDDEIGIKFLDLFLTKAKEGIKVRLILDRLGSRTVNSSQHIAGIIAHGGHVHFYNKLSLRNIFLPHTWLPRNHSKVMLVDQVIAYVGGVCFSKEMAEWRDLHARVTGEVVKQVEKYFMGMWDFISKRKIAKQLDAESRGKEFRFLTRSPRLKRNPIYLELLSHIRNAKHHVYLVTPYFMPPFYLKRAIYKAARRGVTVKIMMSAESDVPIADYVAQSYFRNLIKHGVHILLYQGTVLHAKYSVVDENWATLGSTNLDYLSLRKNREANILTSNLDTVRELNSHFEEDEHKCQIVDMNYIKNRPLQNKILGVMGRIFKRMI